MRPTSIRPARRALPPALAALAALAVLAAGCSKTGKVTGPQGDDSGEHLVAFASDRNSPGTFHVYLYDLDQLGFHLLPGLTAGESDREPAISNDGRFIAFSAVRARGGAGGRDVYVYDRLQQQLVATPGLNTAADEVQPRFTYDAVKLAFVRDSLGVSRVRLYEPVGDTLVALPGLAAAGAGNDEAPAPNLDGTRIAFQSDRSGDGHWHVYVWDRGAGGLLATPGLVSDSNEVEPSLTPDGRWLAFASNRAGGAGGFDVYLYDLQADTLVALPTLNTAADERHPALSSEAVHVVFQSPRAGGAGLDDLYFYDRTDSLTSQPSGFRSSDEDIEPFLRWR
ncbi:MAG TPA: hypothetical protein VGU27_00190 [Candidatus Eisenbacteria bacterium]|nr:hypothetical protein [Candidatus Eisenbacteria bacterium]